MEKFLTNRAVELGFAALFIGLAMSLPALAEQGHADPNSKAAGHEAGHAHHGEEHGSGGHAHTIHGREPAQYFGKGTEFLHVDPQLLFWTLVLFIGLYLVLSAAAWKPILQVLHERDQRIEEGLAQAELAREETRKLLAKQDEATAKAQEQARRILEEARALASRDAEAMIAKAKAEADQSQAQAEQEIEEAKRNALSDLRTVSAEIASRMAERVIARPVPNDEVRRLLEETLQ